MTEQNSFAPGWYPDGNGATRWWDGSAWTEHVAPAANSVAAPAAQPQYAQQPYIGSAPRPQIAPNAPVDSVWIWLAVAVPLITVPAIFLFDFEGYVYGSMYGDLSHMSGFYLGTMALNLLSLCISAFVIVAAWRDYRGLLALGVVRPFHWAFAFIGLLVYLIGRHVVLRKVSRTPGWPLWVFIGLQLLGLIIVMVWLVQTLGTIFRLTGAY